VSRVRPRSLSAQQAAHIESTPGQGRPPYSLEATTQGRDNRIVSRKKNESVKSGPTDLMTREAVERFRKAAEDFTREALRSKESALKVLVDSGIYTKTGKLAKKYRS
jgi:hypothetical protein